MQGGEGTVIKAGVPFASTVKGWVFIIIGIHENVMQSNLFNMDTKGP